MAPAIEVEGLRRTYGDLVAVSELSFVVEPGEVLGVVGPNGSGKTTTVECVQGLRTPTAGTVRVLGLDPVSRPHEVRRRIGSQLQASALPDRIRVDEAVHLFASIGGRADRADGEVLLERWGLASKRTATFASLSGGQRQRLFVALALVNDPEVVFLDEMTTGLDPAARRVAWDLVRQVQARGTTVVLVTHFMDEAAALCDRIAVVVRGRLRALDTPNRLVARFGGGAEVAFEASGGLAWLADVPGVAEVERVGERFVARGPDASRLVPQLGHALVAHDVPVSGLTVRQPTLEDVYLRMIEDEVGDRSPGTTSTTGTVGRHLDAGRLDAGQVDR